MDVYVERACGLDVHKSRVTACLMTGPAGAKPKREIRTFKTFTCDLMEMAQWLKENQCTHVAMESTGVYWKPVYAILEEFGCFELVVGNAQHIKAVPGRKTDVKDAQWIAELLRHGLIKSSFVPSNELREFRDLTRYRKSLVEDKTRQTNRILKLLEQANIKLSSVATDVFGVSGRLMLEAIAENAQTPEQIAQLARGRLRKKIPELQLALQGRVTGHHRELLKLQLNRLEELEKDIAELDKLIDQKLQGYEAEVTLLSTIPGIDRCAAAGILAEVGKNMDKFPSEKAFCAWVGTVPGNNESAGKHRRASARKGNKFLRTLLTQCAWAAVNTRSTYWRDKYFRLRKRRGEGRAVFAIAHKLARVIYSVLKTRTEYRELGSTYLDELDQRRTVVNLVRRLQNLNYDVQLTPKAPRTEAAA